MYDEINTNATLGAAISDYGFVSGSTGTPFSPCSNCCLDDDGYIKYNFTKIMIDWKTEPPETMKASSFTNFQDFIDYLEIGTGTIASNTTNLQNVINTWSFNLGNDLVVDLYYEPCTCNA